MNEHKTYFIALQLSLLLLLVLFLLLLLLLFLHHNTRTRYIRFSASATIQLGRQSTFSTFRLDLATKASKTKTPNIEYGHFSPTLYWQCISPTQAVPVAMEWPKSTQNNTERFVIPN